MALSVAALGWTAAWLLLARGAEQAIDRWISEERSREREWACADRKVGGFPFRLTLDCSSPAFRAPAGAVHAASAGRLTASSSILARRQIDFTISGPLKVSGPQSGALLTWSNLTGSLLHGPDAPDLSVRAQDIRINEASGPGKDWSGASAQGLALRLRKAPDRAPGSGAQEVTLDANGVKAAPADALVGNDEPLKANLSALVLNAEFGSAGRFEEKIERWSASGGRLLIKALTMEKGRSRLEANGDLSLDEKRRPAGQISLRVEGVQPILARLNLPAAPLAIEGLLRGSARSGASSLLENRTLPLDMRNGRLFVGPIRTPLILPPLF
ncbi:MAG: DUF2125 domain-containing protein [Beijerinckiaceae bacterium]|nr:DUF2125 domain-containing protein [Beijerinckiaceae bacterium]